MSTKEEEILITSLVRDLFILFYKDYDLDAKGINPPSSPVVFSRVVRFVREFTNNPEFIMGVERKMERCPKCKNLIYPWDSGCQYCLKE